MEMGRGCMAFLFPPPGAGSVPAERCRPERLAVMVHMGTTQAFPFYSLPKINQGSDLSWANLLPQCSLSWFGCGLASDGR